MSIIKTIIRLFARFVHTIINLRTLQILKAPFRVFYYHWIACEFASCGKNCYFEGFSTLVGAKRITLGSNLYIGRDVIWEVRDKFRDQKFDPHMQIGDNSSFGDGGHITCVNSVRIGNGVRIGRKVFITDNSHGASVRSQLSIPAHLRPVVSKGAVVINDNVWIGEMACIMPGVTIGEGSIIAANSVVTHDIPAFCVAAGVPARVVKVIE